MTSGSVSLQVLQFTMTGATLTGMSMSSTCVRHQSLSTGITAAAVASAEGPITLDATSLTMTVSGSAVVFDPGSPPGPAPLTFPTPLSVTTVTIVATQFTSATLSMPGMSASFVSC